MIQYSNTHKKEVVIPEIEALPDKDGIAPEVLRQVKALAIMLITARPEDYVCVHITIGDAPHIKSAQAGIQVTGK